MRVVETIAARFNSTDPSPAESAYITADEWAELASMLAAIPKCLAIMEAARPLVLTLETLKDAAE